MLTGKLGMEPEPGDHQWYRMVVDGRTIARTPVSRGNQKYKTLGVDLTSKMAKQLGVSNAFFTGLVQCSKSKADYLAFREGTDTR